MKISKSKQELARIISENGGWREMAGSAAQCAGGEISFWHDVATKRRGEDWRGSYLGSCEDIKFTGVKLPNWHQTILSREEYFHLYQAPDSKPEFCDSVMRAIPEPRSRPTIEQLAVDYINAKDYAERKQQEADDAKGDANEALRKLEIAGEAIGLLLSPINAKKEPELVIAVQVGDEVECIESNVNPNKYRGMIGTALGVDDSSTPYLVDFGGEAKIWCHEVKFIRRP